MQVGKLGSLVLLLAVIAGCNRPFLLEAQVGTAQPLEANIDANLKVDLDLVARSTNRPLETIVLSGPAGAPRVAIIELDGLLIHENAIGLGSIGANPLVLFHEKLIAAEADPKVTAVVLRINSPGGTVTGSETMAQELKNFRKRTGKPVIAHILETGAGGAYRVAIEADQIFASPGALVGGVGVIFPLINMDKTLEIMMLTDQSIKAGNLIDLGSNSRKLENNEKEMLDAMAREHHERFQKAVWTARPERRIPDASLDGRVMTSSKAKGLGLIDGIGTLEESIDLAYSSVPGKFGAGSGSIGSFQVVMYRHKGETAVSIYDLAPNQPLQGTFFPAAIPGVDRGRQQTFWYLWMADQTLPRTLGK